MNKRNQEDKRHIDIEAITHSDRKRSLNRDTQDVARLSIRKHM